METKIEHPGIKDIHKIGKAAERKEQSRRNIWNNNTEELSKINDRHQTKEKKKKNDSKKKKHPNSLKLKKKKKGKLNSWKKSEKTTLYYKIPNQCSLKLSRSSKTREVWETQPRGA